MGRIRRCQGRSCHDTHPWCCTRTTISLKPTQVKVVSHQVNTGTYYSITWIQARFCWCFSDFCFMTVTDQPKVWGTDTAKTRSQETKWAPRGQIQKLTRRQEKGTMPNNQKWVWRFRPTQQRAMQDKFNTTRGISAVTVDKER